MSQKKKIKVGRREFLMNASAAMLAVPAIRLFETDAYAQANPKRFVLFFSPNGTFRPNFWPQLSNDGESLNSNFNNQVVPLANVGALPSITSPFSSLMAKTTLVHGLHNPRIGGDDHQQGSRRNMSGIVSPQITTGTTIDNHVANQLGQDLLATGVHYYEHGAYGAVSHVNAGNPTQVVDNSRQFFNQVIGSANQGPPLDTSFIDLAAADISPLLKYFSKDVQTRLEFNLDSLSDSVNRIRAMEASECRLAPGSEVPPGDSNGFRQSFNVAHSRFNIDMISTALACNRSRVASFMFGCSISSIIYDNLTANGQPIIDDHHSISHRNQGADFSGAEGPNWRAEYSAISQYHASEIARLAQNLDAIPEGNGTMLDNTIILWINELGAGEVHSHRSIPTAIIGGANMGIKGGQMVSMYNQQPDSGNFLNSICDHLGVSKIIAGKNSLPKSLG